MQFRGTQHAGSVCMGGTLSSIFDAHFIWHTARGRSFCGKGGWTPTLSLSASSYSSQRGDSAVGPLSARLPARPSCSVDGTLIMATDQSGPSQGHKTRPGQLARGATSVQKRTVINLIAFLGSDSNNN